MAWANYFMAFGMMAMDLCPVCHGLGAAMRTTLGDGGELSVTNCGTPTISFPNFIQQFNLPYEPGTEEYLQREDLFKQRVQSIEEYNCAPKGPWKAAVNHLAASTDAELQQLRGHRQTWGRPEGGGSTAKLNAGEWPRMFGHRKDKDLSSFPSAFSWSNLTSIQEPRDQGSCGSCWAFAADTVMRSHAEIVGRDHTFSVSQLVACAPNPKQCGGKGGCEGSTAELAYEYVMHAGAVDELRLPYPTGGGQASCPAELQTARQGTTTPYRLLEDGSEVHVLRDGDSAMQGGSIGMTGWTKLPENREEPVMRALISSGPVAVAVAAGFEWNFYWSGVMSHKGCDKDHVINHAVVLFGYGIADQAFHGKVGYWHIKNSWGSHWGEQGNLRLERTTTEEKICGWDKKPEQGSGCIGGPKEVWVCGTCGVLYDTVVPHFVAPESKVTKSKR